MSTVAYRAALVREIEQVMERVEARETLSMDTYWLQTGRLDAYAHVLLLLKDEDL